MSIQDTPRGGRVHIGVFGKRNAGKSSLINAITGQDTALVSNVAGTTTDPVYKSMEIHGIGPCVFIDTGGYDDTGELGAKRVTKTLEAKQKTDIALLVISDTDIDTELEWIQEFNKQKTPVILIINKGDIIKDIDTLALTLEKQSGLIPLIVSAKENIGIDKIKEALIRNLPEDFEVDSITGKLVHDGDLVLLVMPQDIQAPKGRLILPQVQTIRDLLDKKCIVMSITLDQLDNSLTKLTTPPALIITDSQVFKTVYDKKPKESRLTSFSVLFAQYKGDLQYFIDSTTAIELLTPDSKVLIAEACTHAPLSEDIGRVKIPKALKKKVGEQLTIHIVSGTDFPQDLSSYDLIIHCGACMFNRKYVLSRVNQAKTQGIPMTNYGVVMAYLAGILDKIDLT